MDIKLNYILPKSSANGPGARAVAWVQGCSIHCPDCNNTDTWDPEGGFSMSVDALIDLFLIDSSLDGITITGGEPLDQYQVVKCVCEKIYPSTSVFLTTGYTLRQIMEKGYTDILNCVDILCSGPFDPKRITSNEWRGSTNQGINYLTKRGLELADRSVVSKEFFINAHGDVLKTGFTN